MGSEGMSVESTGCLFVWFFFEFFFCLFDCALRGNVCRKKERMQKKEIRQMTPRGLLHFSFRSLLDMMMNV